MTIATCRCGAVELEIGAEPTVQFYCHCDDCQAMHGAACRFAVLPVKDGPPHFKGRPARFGGTDETVDW